MARLVGRFKLRSKLVQLYVRLSIIPLSYQMIWVSSGIIRHYVVAFVSSYFALPNTSVFNSLEELCTTRVAVVSSFDGLLNPWGEYIYLSIHVYVCVYMCGGIYIYIYIYDIKAHRLGYITYFHCCSVYYDRSVIQFHHNGTGFTCMFSTNIHFLRRIIIKTLLYLLHFIIHYTRSFPMLA